MEASGPPRAGLATRAGGRPGRLLGPDPRHRSDRDPVHSRRDQMKDSMVNARGRGPSPSPYPLPESTAAPTQYCLLNARKLCLQEHAFCAQPLPKPGAREARPAWGSSPGRPQVYGYGGVSEGDLVVLATPEACPRALGPVLQDPLSASSLTRSPQGVSGTDRG